MQNSTVDADVLVEAYSAPMQPVFQIPLRRMKKPELLDVCERHGISITKSAKVKAQATVAVLLIRLRGNPLISSHDHYLEQNHESANERRARESAESDAMIYDPRSPHGRLVPTQIVITKPGGNVADWVHAKFGEYQQHHFYGFGAGAETAPASKAPHANTQAAGQLRLAEQSSKAIKILKKHIRKWLNLPPNENYQICVLFAKTNKGQTLKGIVGYTLKEHGEDSFRYYAHNYTPKFLHECYSEHKAMSSAAREHGKTLYKPKLMNQITNFYYNNLLNPLQLSMEVMLVLMLEDGYNFHWSWAAAPHTGAYDGGKANAIFAINNRPTRKAFDHHKAFALVFGREYALNQQEWHHKPIEVHDVLTPGIKNAYTKKLYEDPVPDDLLDYFKHLADTCKISCPLGPNSV